MQHETKWTGSNWKTTHNLIDCMGTDSVYILDGRNSLENMMKDAESRIEKLLKSKYIKGYKIYRGSRIQENNFCLTGKSWD